MIPLHQIPHDPYFPQLPLLCDKQSMKDLFEQQMRHGNLLNQPACIQSLQIRHIRYKPGRYVMVLYGLIFQQQPGQTDYPKTWYVRAFQRGKSQSDFQKVQACLTQKRQSDSFIVHFPEIESIAWGFPYDRKIKTLPQALDQQRLRSQVIPSLLGPQRMAEWDLVDLVSKIIHYVPEHTCTMRVTQYLRHRSMEHFTVLSAFGKTFATGKGLDSYRTLQQLWDSQARQLGTLVIPEPLAFEAETNTLWQSGLKGTPLSNFPLSDPRMGGWMEKAGTTLATLHGTRLRDLPSHPVSDILTWLDDAIGILVSLRPACKEPLNQLVAILKQQAAYLRSHPPVTLHGDPHRKNLFLQDKTVALIDLDSLTTGPPLYDVGSCLASLWFRVALGEISTPLAKTLSESFLNGYQSVMFWSFSEIEVTWHIAVFLITEQASRCATTFKANHLDILDHLIHLAQSLLSGDVLFNGTQWQNKNCLSA